MKRERSSSKAGLFLIELIIAIVFFAISSAICIQLFVKAHLISSRSNEISVATTIAQNEAEAFKADSGAYIEFLEGNGMVIAYDSRGNRMGSDQAGAATYYLVCQIDEHDNLREAALAVYTTEEPVAGGAAQAVCRIDVKAYTGPKA